MCKFYIGAVVGVIIDPLEIFRCRWKDNIKMDLKSVGRAWTGFIWLAIRTGGGLL